MTEEKKPSKENEPVILNLGCGDAKMEGAINVDYADLPTADMNFDLEKFPYPFEDSSVDEVHLYFVLEHLVKQMEVIAEIYRILKPGGMFYIRVPHASGCYVWGELTHLRGYVHTSFDLFSDDSPRSYYTNVRFKTIKKKCKYFLTYPYDFYKHIGESWRPHWENRWYADLIKAYIHIIQFLIDLNPAFFERFWCYWVGGAAEVYVELEKI